MPRTDTAFWDEAIVALQRENYRRQWDIVHQRMEEAANAEVIRAVLNVHRYQAERNREQKRQRTLEDA